MIRKWIIITLLTLLIIICAGCGPSFNDPDIIAYVNGETVYEQQRDQYVYIKKQFVSRLVQLCDETERSKLGTGVVLFDEIYARAKQAEEYSEYEWHMDYYITFIIADALDEMERKYPKELGIKEFNDSIVDPIIVAAHAREAACVMDFEMRTDYIEIIENTAQHFQITYNECVDQIFYPYIMSEQIEQSLMGKFRANIFDPGDERLNGIMDDLKTHGGGFDALEGYYAEGLSAYVQYKNELVEKAEIIKRL